MEERNMKTNPYAFWSISRSGHSFIKNNVRSWMDKREVFAAENWPRMKFDSKMEEMERPMCAVTIRDPFNNIASLMGHLLQSEGYPLSAMDKYVPRVLEYWCDMVEYLGEYRCSRQAIPVFYNRFVSDQDYRKMICSTLGGEYNEEFLNVVPPNGGFSSFDGDSLQNRGSEMKTIERWKKALDGEHKDRYVSYLTRNPRILDLCENINFQYAESLAEIAKEFKEAVDGQKSSGHNGVTNGAIAKYIRQDPKFMRPAEVDVLLGGCEQSC